MESTLRPVEIYTILQEGMISGKLIGVYVHCEVIVVLNFDSFYSLQEFTMRTMYVEFHCA